MYNVYFDSGTSNTRAYLLKDYTLVDLVKKNIGSKDSSIAGSNLPLIKGLKEIYDLLLGKNQLSDAQIEGIYASGMITSPFGIKEVPHLSTPISLEKLFNGIYIHFEQEFFHRDIHLIRGAKTIPDGFNPNRHNIYAVNNVRGEEIEVFGILAELPEWQKNDNIALLLPGSHTHVAYVKQGVFSDILSTFSGELFYAVSVSTILANSVQCPSEQLDEEMVLLGFRNLKEFGVNRALYIAHATKIFNACGNLERKSYLEGVINGGVVLALEKMVEGKWQDLDRILIASNNSIIRKIYEIMFQESTLNVEALPFSTREEQSFALKGFIEMLKKGRKT